MMMFQIESSCTWWWLLTTVMIMMMTIAFNDHDNCRLPPRTQPVQPPRPVLVADVSNRCSLSLSSNRCLELVIIIWNFGKKTTFPLSFAWWTLSKISTNLIFFVRVATVTPLLRILTGFENLWWIWYCWQSLGQCRIIKDVVITVILNQIKVMKE